MSSDGPPSYWFTIPPEHATPRHPTACQAYFNVAAPREIFLDFGAWKPDEAVRPPVCARLALTRALALEVVLALQTVLRQLDQPPPPIPPSASADPSTPPRFR